ncbi:spore cortex biosynthesis protein YabQ [Anaeroselena agilis]|uniref:Spore cortex biosynthesis protein YabQ n=1 Tax=Anaeroselena agilis TaxID=3063788 RepID=A0ABU3P169_9FIRM|nr:spore cortex biosynthesis protein YabQ [Selenomonadales bacterium 4137-cl]
MAVALGDGGGETMSAEGQINTFVITVATGLLLGVAFDFYRVLRAFFRPRWLFTSFADLAYWLLATGLVFLALLLGNWGELRLYTFIGLALGAFGYYRLLSRQAVRLIIVLLRLAVGVARAARTVIVYTLVKPAAYMANLAARPARYARRKFAARRPPPDDSAPPR